jgi:hypothetical protein
MPIKEYCHTIFWRWLLGMAVVIKSRYRVRPNKLLGKWKAAITYGASFISLGICWRCPEWL